MSHVRPRIYTSLTILITTLLMLAIGTASASAGPAPIVEPPGEYPPDSPGPTIDGGSWATLLDRCHGASSSPSSPSWPSPLTA